VKAKVGYYTSLLKESAVIIRWIFLDACMPTLSIPSIPFSRNSTCP